MPCECVMSDRYSCIASREKISSFIAIVIVLSPSFFWMHTHGHKYTTECVGYPHAFGMICCCECTHGTCGLIRYIDAGERESIVVVMVSPVSSRIFPIF